MLNSFLSNLLFGSSNSTNTDGDSNNTTQSAITNTTTGIQQLDNKITTTKNDIPNEKYLDVRSDVDWVIIDPSDNDEVKKHLKRKMNSMSRSMQMSEYGLNSLFESTTTQQRQEQYATNNGAASDGATISDDSMDRSVSFDVQSRPMTPFEMQKDEESDEIDEIEKNKQQQQQQQQQYNKTFEQESWLITPLPSLVSLHTSQKSIIENAPLENLLIEHPSMSVFITKDEIAEAIKETEMADSSLFALINNNNNNETPAIMQTVEQVLVEKVKKNKAKKAKKQNKENAASTPVTTTTTTTTPSGRQNALCNNKQASNNKLINSNQIFKDRCFTKLQEKCKYYVKNVNLRQRKYHNLQQPQYMNVSFVNIRH